MKIEIVCRLDNFREFMILSTCRSFIPREMLEDQDIFPERSTENGTMYVEAEDKETLSKKGEIQFVRASNVIGIIYNSKSGSTRLKWRQIRNDLGKLTGEASTNSLVNLFAARVLDQSYLKAQVAQA